jgi:hypothetical protein
MIILSVRPCGTSRLLLHEVKSYDLGPSHFTSHPRGRFAADFLNPQPLGPVASTLTTTPPRQCDIYSVVLIKNMILKYAYEDINFLEICLPT